MKRNYILILGVVISVFLAFACGDSDTTTTTTPTGNYDKAVEYYNEGVNLDENYPDQAMEKYKLSLQNSTDIGEVYLNIGMIYFKKGDVSNAEYYFKIALATFERTNKKVSGTQSLERLKAICNYDLGLLYLTKNDKATALSYFEKAMDTDPACTKARDYYNANK